MNTIKLKDENNIVRDIPSYLDMYYNNVTKKMQLLSANSMEEKWKIASNDIALRLKNSGIDYDIIKKATGVSFGR